MSAKRTAVDLAATIRAAIRKAHSTPNELAQEAGVDRSVMTRFLKGERGINLDTASRLCRVLQLELQPGKGR